MQGKGPSLTETHGSPRKQVNANGYACRITISSEINRELCSEVTCSASHKTEQEPRPIGLLQDPVTWYGSNYAGTQVTQWDFQNKEKSGWTGASSFVLEVPLCNLRPSIINSAPCEWIVQRAHWSSTVAFSQFLNSFASHRTFSK